MGQTPSSLVASIPGRKRESLPMTEPQNEPRIVTDSPAEGGASDYRQQRSARPLITGADIYVVLILGVLLAALLSRNFMKFLEFIYSPVVFLLVVTVCVTYLFFKSSDRSRAYKEELELIRGLRKRDAGLRRDLERRLKTMSEQLRESDENLAAEDRRRLGEEIDQLIEELRKT